MNADERWCPYGRASAPDRGYGGRSGRVIAWQAPPAPELPDVVLELIRAELDVVRAEWPDWTPRQQLREARRRCAVHMAAAADEAEAQNQGLVDSQQAPPHIV